MIKTFFSWIFWWARSLVLLTPGMNHMESQILESNRVIRVFVTSSGFCITIWCFELAGGLFLLSSKRPFLLGCKKINSRFFLQKFSCFVPKSSFSEFFEEKQRHLKTFFNQWFISLENEKFKFYFGEFLRNFWVAFWEWLFNRDSSEILSKFLNA